MNDGTDNSKTEQSGTEQLIAYLDGELDPEESRQVEQRLSDDESYRQQLKRLDEAWALLDHLPQSEVDDVFTRTTVAMVAVAAENDASLAERGRRWRLWVASSLSIATVGLAAIVGYLITRYHLAGPDRELVKDLPVIEKVDVYRYAESMEWLEMLDESGLFGDSEELDDAI